MLAKLVPVMGFDGPSEVPLSPEEALVLGRADSAGIQLRQSKVSRQHCRILFEKGFYNIEDLDSKNGTWVNNRRIHKAILFHHDRIAIGSSEFRFVIDGHPDDETSHIIGDPQSDMIFATEIRQDSLVNTTSSLLMELPGTGVEQDREELERGLSVVCEVINSVNAEHQLDRLLETIMDSVMGMTDCDRGYLIAAKKVNGVLMPLVGRNKGTLPAYARDTFSRSIVSECYEKGVAILMSDPDEEINPSESVVTQQIQSIMCAPMMDKEGPVGVIYVDSLLGSRKFTERDLKILSAVGNQAGIAIRRAQLSQQVETLFRESMRTVINLVEVKDEYTYGHSERVTAVAVAIAELCALDKADVRDVELAGLLHDVGKLAVRLDILQKPSSLTPAEYEAVKRHPIAGAAILSNVEDSERIAEAIRHHHERWDGEGYPDGLAGELIPLLARVLALADAFDSMASGRPYRGMLSRAEIIEEMSNGSGTQFDPYLARRFVDALEDDEAFQRRLDRIYTPKDAEEDDDNEKTTFE